MKQSYIKTTFRGFFFIAIKIIITTNCFAQEPKTELLEMMPEIPSEINEPSQRAEYLVMHFWDKFDFRDTSFLMTDHLLERSFVDYIDLLSIVPYETTEKSINTLMKKTEGKHSIFSFILKLSEQYLYEPASPLCNEEKLIPFLQYALQSSLLDGTEKIRPAFLLESITKNRIGTMANDITYTLINREAGNLHSVKADYTLLYFNDPECEDCIMLIKQLITSSVINNLINQGKLKILTVYVNDDVEAWEKHASDVSDLWIYSRDAEQKINIEGIYNIKQFPTMYLLDIDKKILLKDTTFENLENYFRMF
ncbi:MAG: DUF5106 domain-containing protein [Tannerella sp.]|jgi:thioredoxin-related protein|nr:DUF5106 domain-containing protein [Tannerella sp.]